MVISHARGRHHGIDETYKHAGTLEKIKIHLREFNFEAMLQISSRKAQVNAISMVKLHQYQSPVSISQVSLT